MTNTARAVDTVDETADEVAEEVRPRRKDAARNHQALVAAARVVFAERGLEASLDDIARAAGVGVGTAYRHFANKHELARAVFTEAMETVAVAVERARGYDDPWDGLVFYFTSVAEAQSADRGLRDVLCGVYDNDDIERVIDQLAEATRDLLDRAKRAGAVRADAEVSDIAMLTLMLGTVSDIAGSVEPELWRRYLPVLLEGLRPGRPLPVAAVGEDDMRTAMAAFKQNGPCGRA